MRFSALALALVTLAAAQEPGIEPRRIEADLAFLSSKAVGSRAVLDRGSEIAARFVAAEFAKAGLAPAFGDSFLQPFEIVRFRSEPSKALFRIERQGRAEKLRAGRDFRVSHAAEVEIQGSVVFAGYGITAPALGYDDYAGIDARGKIVLVFQHEPQENDEHSVFQGAGFSIHSSPYLKTVNAGRHGATAILTVSEPLRKHSGLLDPPGVPRSPDRGSAVTAVLAGDSIPSVTLSDHAAELLLAPLGTSPAELQRRIDQSLKPASAGLPGITVALKSALAEQTRGTTWNVAAVLEGSDPALRDQAIVLGSHYDHLPDRGEWFYPGANDNGSGTVAVIELARVLAGAKPRRPIVFVSFGAEENGLLGSYYYAGHAPRRTAAVINLDMVGRNEQETPETKGHVSVAADSRGELNVLGLAYSPDLRRLLELADRRVGLHLDDKYDRDMSQNALFRCDHFPFLAARVPAVWLFGGWHPGYHEPVDTVDKVDFEKLGKVAKLAYWAALEAANAAEAPKFVE